MKSLFDCDDYACRVVNVYRAVSKPGWSIASNRRHYELIYKPDGSSDQIFEDCTLKLVPHSLYFIPARESSNRVFVERVGTVINIIFDLYGCKNEDRLMPEVLKLSENNQIAPLFERALAVWERRRPSSQLEVQSIMFAVLAKAVSIRTGQYRSSDSYRRIAPAIELIESEYRRPIGLPELTSLCGISDEYLRRLFKFHISATPLEYLRTVRLRSAREQLIGSQRSIAEIARSCGFDDPRYFTRLYTREFGEPPSATARGTVG